MRGYLTSIFKPGALSQRDAFEIGCLVMVILGICDFASGIDIRLGALYILPIALVGIHCSGRLFLILSILLSLICQLSNSIAIGDPLQTLVTDLIVSFISACLVGVLSDSIRHNLEEVRVLSVTDALTHLQNRRSFEMSVGTEIDRQRRYGGKFSLLFIDLDNFKKLNDSQGHTAGDNALKIVGEILQNSLRDTDVCARFGGDEFAVLLPNSTQEDCEIVGQQLVSKIRDGMQASNYDVTASIGTSTFLTPPDSMAAAFHLADEMMYAAKSLGKNTVVFR